MIPVLVAEGYRVPVLQCEAPLMGTPLETLRWQCEETKVGRGKALQSQPFLQLISYTLLKLNPENLHFKLK